MQMTDDQLIACWKQTRALALRNQRQQDKLREQLEVLKDQSVDYTVELVKRGYRITLPVEAI